MDLGNITGTINSLAAKIDGQTPLNKTPFFSDLLPASWRGVPFGIERSSVGGGRKVALHDYPYVDGVNIEDLGARGKRWNMEGFLIEGGGAYGGNGTLKEQVKLFIQACDQQGKGALVHPLLGTNSLFNLLDYEITQNLDGRVATIHASFLQSLVTPIVNTTINTQAQTNVMVSASLLSVVNDFVSSVHNLVRVSVGGVLGVVNQFTTEAGYIAFSATSLYSMVSAMPGEIGRYIGAVFPSQQKNPSTTITSLIGAGSAASVAVSVSMESLSSASGTGSIPGIGNGIVAVTQALYAANPDPAQALQSMQLLIAASPSSASSMLPGGSDANSTSDLIRRAAVICMAQATAQYQPVSYNDAQNVRTTVCDAIDAEMTIAGDEGLDTSYNALMTLKIAVSQDLTARGASLAQTVTVTSQIPMSSLVWAQKLYLDAGREKQLVQAANPIHPAFMPTSFQALAS